MSKRERRDNDRWSGERRDSQPEDEQQRRSGETEAQEGDSLTALKAILAKVASLLKPLQLSPEESIRLVEQLYGKVLETDLQLAGETDDTRKSSVLAAIQNATISRSGDKIAVEYSTGERPEAGGAEPRKTEAAPAETRPSDPAAESASGEATPIETVPPAV